MVLTDLQVRLGLTLEALEDLSSSGRQRPWRGKKVTNELLALAYDHINLVKARRLRDCSTELRFRVCPDGRKRLESGNFCRVRLCPICSWRRGLKIYRQTQQVLHAMASEKSYRYLLLTLTVKNCSAAELSGTIDQMMAAWNRFALIKAFKTAVKGWYRGLEVTHNVNPDSPNYDTFHPHFHLLLAVNPSYFTGRTYVSHDKWQAMWMQAAHLDYSPQVDVRRVKGNTAKAVAEVAKYSVKESDYIFPEDWDLTIGTVRTLDKALDKRRFAAFGGVFKDWHRRLHLDDTEDGDLVHTDLDQFDDMGGLPLMSYYWYAGYQQYYGVRSQ